MQWTKQGFEEYKDQILTSDCALVVADRPLGRRVKSEDRARKLYRAQLGLRGRYIFRNTFMPPKGSTTLSVDCLGVVPDAEIAQIAIRQLAKEGKEFYGWYVLTVRDIHKAQCVLKISPTAENRYHAEIILPIDPTLDPKSNKYRGELRRIANDLATLASFVSYGDWIEDVYLERN